jgi:hypothetical protein
MRKYILLLYRRESEEFFKSNTYNMRVIKKKTIKDSKNLIYVKTQL